MRKGTEYARKLKKAQAKFRRNDAPQKSIDPTDPIEQLVLAVLSQETCIAWGRKALAGINEHMVDSNEVRVSAPSEIAHAVGECVPRAIHRAKALVRMLNAIFAIEHTVSLDRLKSRGLREAKQYIEDLDGSSSYVVASVMLWSLNGHAIPVSDAGMEFLAKSDLVHPSATRQQVQSFLERHVSAADAKAFCLALEIHAMARASASAARNPKPAGTSRPKAKKKKARTTGATKKTTSASTRVRRAKTKQDHAKTSKTKTSKTKTSKTKASKAKTPKTKTKSKTTKSKSRKRAKTR